LEKESYIWKTQPTFGFVSKQGIVEIFWARQRQIIIPSMHPLWEEQLSALCMAINLLIQIKQSSGKLKNLCSHALILTEPALTVNNVSKHSTCFSIAILPQSCYKTTTFMILALHFSHLHSHAHNFLQMQVAYKVKNRYIVFKSLANLPITKHTAVVPSLCNSQP
jgi:hypothetical protein